MRAWQRDDEDLWDEVPGYEDLCDDEDLWQILAWDEDLWAMLVPSGAPVNTYFEALGPVLGLLWGPLGHLSGPSWAPGWPPKLGLEAQCQKTPFYGHSNYENMPPMQAGALFSLRHPISKQSQGSSDSFGNPWISVHGRSSPYIIPYSPIQFV